MLRSSKHGHGRLVLTNTRRPWHGTWVRVRGPDDCTPVDCLRSYDQHDRTTIDCVQSWSSDCAVMRSAFSETGLAYWHLAVI